jgi:hypothetical protein
MFAHTGLIAGSGVNDYRFKQLWKRVLKECVQQIRKGCEWPSATEVSTIIVVVRKYVSRLVLSVTAVANNRY